MGARSSGRGGNGRSEGLHRLWSGRLGRNSAAYERAPREEKEPEDRDTTDEHRDAAAEARPFQPAVDHSSFRRQAGERGRPDTVPLGFEL
jgi:hypothetical protein